MVQEGDYLAVFNSAHRVMKAEQLLKSFSMPILLIPAPRQLQTDCGLAIRFNITVKDEIFKLLANENIQPAFVALYKNGTYTTLEENKI